MINTKLRAKAITKKLITLRTKARLNRFIEKEFSYVKIKSIDIDFLNLPEELNKDYFDTLKEQEKILIEQISKEVFNGVEK